MKSFDSTRQLVGKYVSLRQLSVSDSEITYSWRSGGRNKYLKPGAMSVEEQKKWIISRPQSEINFIIDLKCGTPVGMISLVDIDFLNKRAETGRFLIGDENAVKGIPVAVEAMKLLYLLAFEEFLLLRLYGFIASENKLMIKWQKYLGMKEEGCMRQHYYINSSYQDCIIFGILKEEFKNIFMPRANVLLSMAN